MLCSRLKWFATMRLLNDKRLWMLIFFFLYVVSLIFLIGIVAYVDPFFHYHQPYTDKFYYELYNERSQNDGIIKHFNYDSIITGTSMAENFKPSEYDELFDGKSIKITYAGASYREINDAIAEALTVNSKINRVIRGLDMSGFIQDKDFLREDMGDYPSYLYDKNPFNDVKYTLNEDIVSKSLHMIIGKYTQNTNPGITSFDDYAYYADQYTYSREETLRNVDYYTPSEQSKYLSDEEKEILIDNISQNVIIIAKENPNVEFYYFITPYSIAYWLELWERGEIYKQIEAESIMIELCLEVENIKLFSLNMDTNITTNLDNYKDPIHYGPWINSLILEKMKEEEDLLTIDNHIQYLEDEINFYTNYDYAELMKEVEMIQQK